MVLLIARCDLPLTSAFTPLLVGRLAVVGALVLVALSVALVGGLDIRVVGGGVAETLGPAVDVTLVARLQAGCLGALLGGEALSRGGRGSGGGCGGTRSLSRAGLGSGNGSEGANDDGRETHLDWLVDYDFGKNRVLNESDEASK